MGKKKTLWEKWFGLKENEAEKINEVKNAQKSPVDAEQQKVEQIEEDVQSEMHNLIIIDESGSMDCIRPQVVTGCNETLQTIRAAKRDLPNQKQYVSIYFFNTNILKSRYIIKNKPIEEVNDLIVEDYCPTGLTPLFDAMGTTLTELWMRIEDKKNVNAVVTVITDGYENSSREFCFDDIQRLVKKCMNKGWVFTFIGANIDVRKTAESLNISNTLQFEQTEEGTKAMFEKDAICRENYYKELEKYKKASKEERKMFHKKMNSKFFDV